MNHNKQFRKIAEEALEKGENVPCNIEEFRVGLAAMWHCIKERLEYEETDPTAPDILEQLDD